MINIGNRNNPDERRSFEHGTSDAVTLAGVTFSRAVFLPGGDGAATSSPSRERTPATPRTSPSSGPDGCMFECTTEMSATSLWATRISWVPATTRGSSGAGLA